MEQLLKKMAQRASQDSTLFASLIHEYGRQNRLQWSQIAAELDIDEAQLAKLALCRRPRRDLFLQDMAQVSTYVGVSSAHLSQFVRRMETPQPEPAATRSFSRPSFKWEVSSMFKRRALAFSIAALVILLFAAFAFAQPANAEATLVVSAGSATVNQNDRLLMVIPRQTRSTAAAGSIVTVGEGDTISLAAGSAAQLRLYDGSTVDLYEGTSVAVSELVTNEESYRVRLTMFAGRTVNRVVKLLGADDAFEVRTPSSTASVRGTIFSVEVLNTDSTHVAVDEGVVRVALNGMPANYVDVLPGQAVTAVVGQPLIVVPQNEEAAPAPTAVPTPTEQPTATSQPTEEPATAVYEGEWDNGLPDDVPAFEPGIDLTTGQPPTTAITPTGTITPVVDTEPPDETVVNYCDGTTTEQHPEGASLAAQYGVGYDEIMGWFCSGYGFGEIVLAYDLSGATGTSVGEIFGLRASGLGWGQINELLLGGGGTGNPGNNNGNSGNNGGGNNGGGNNSGGNNGGDNGSGNGNPGGNNGGGNGNDK